MEMVVEQFATVLSDNWTLLANMFEKFSSKQKEKKTGSKIIIAANFAIQTLFTDFLTNIIYSRDLLIATLSCWALKQIVRG
jgi:hypothetical protein